MRNKNNKLKLLIIVLILFLCPFFAAINNTFGIYRSILNTTVNLTVLDSSTNFVITFDENYTGGNTWNVLKTYNEQLGSDYTLPSRTGYNFLGWYTQGGTKIDQTTPATANVTYYAHWEKIVCMRAQEGTLHTETCASSGGCIQHGYAVNSTITYGTVPVQGSPSAGYAYDCDVNNDGTYDSATERFYFVREHDSNGEKAVLVHYTSFDANGQMDNSNTRIIYTYDDGKAYLPNSTLWSNPALTSFDGKVARYINQDDLIAACGGNVVYNDSSYLSSCQFFMETSRYQSNSLGRSGLWLEKVNNTINRIHTHNVEVQIPEDPNSSNAVRPVIEIPITTLDGYRSDAGYTITFETHGGSSVASVTRYAGEMLGNIVTTREHFDFDGWYANFENDVYTNLVTASTVITGNMTLHAKWVPKQTHTVTFDAGEGTINGESTFDVVVDHGGTVNQEDFPEAVNAGMELDDWYIGGDTTLPFTSATVVNDNITVVAIWTTAHYVAKVGNTKYETLLEAVNAVPITSTKTRITILDNIELTSSITISNTRWIELDIGTYTISNSADYVMVSGTQNNALFVNSGKIDIIGGTLSVSGTSKTTGPYIIYNKQGALLNISDGLLTYNNSLSTEYKPIENVGGTVNVSGGTITCNGQPAAINNKSGGVVNVSGGVIKGTGTTKGQALYMDGNSVTNISGTAYLENTSMSSGKDARAAVDNAGGTLTITGGTIVSKQYNAVMSRASTTNSLTIGTDDGNIDTTTPVLRGKEYGLNMDTGKVSVYDGIFESINYTPAISVSASNINKPTEFINDSTVIDNVTYHTTYLSPPSYTVTFYYENGDDPTEISVANGNSIGSSMPQDPVKSGYYFAGWYDEDTLITSSTVVNGSMEVYAKWVRSVNNATITTNPNPFVVEVSRTGQISIAEDDIESVTYSSSSDSIATVDQNGEVTGQSVGTATIAIVGSKSGDTRTISVIVETLKHTITYKDGDTIIDTRRVVDETAIGDALLAAPINANYIFNGWFINGDPLYPVTSATVVTNDIIAVASWTPNIQLATIPSTFAVTINRSSTLTVTGPDGMESYTIASIDNTIATVTQNGANATVAGIALGTTTINVIGSRSNMTRTISVEVTTAPVYTVTFLDDDNATVITTAQIEDGNTFGELLPIPEARENYIFAGWFINDVNLTPLTASTPVTGEITVVAAWKEKISIATITTTPDPFAVKVGNTGQITVTATGGGLVESCTFASSNTNIAEVDTNTGEVLGSSYGTVTITVTGSESGLTRTVELVINNLNTITFDPDNGEELIYVSVADGETIDGNVPVDPINTGYALDGWYLYDEVNEVLTTTPISTTEIITGNKTYKAKWVSNTYFAAIDTTTGTQYYTSIKNAIASVTTSNETVIRIIQDISNTSGQTIIPVNKNIVLSGGNHTIACGAGTTNQLIMNKGTLTIASGTFICNKSTLAVLQNESGAQMNIEGGTIHNENNRGAIFNNGGAVEISGGTLSSVATIRPVVQNAANNSSILMTGGEVIQMTTSSVTTSGKDDGRGAIRAIANTTVTITGGRVISNSPNSAGVHVTGGTLVVGTDHTDNTYDMTTPVIQGENYGIISAVNYSIYDGIIKGKTNNRAVDNFSRITGIETGAEKQEGTDGDYYTLYYTVGISKYHINFDANDGTVTDSFLEFNLNEPITAGDLPTPTRANHTFDGWYTDSELTTPFAEFTPNALAEVTYYAKWTFNASLEPVSHNVLSNAMVDYFTNVSSWVVADATDPSNSPPREASESNGYDNGHSMFKSSIDNVFTSNSCSYCGADNNCDSPRTGTYCDQPNAYDTGLTENLNVYLYQNGEKGSQVTYTTSSGGKIYNMIPGVTYYWESVSDNTKYGVVAATGQRRTLKTSVRNLRDLGGLSASNETVSGTIKYGRLYRGAQITTAAGVSDLNKLGITREFDVRGNGDGNQTYKLDYYDTGTKTNYTDIEITNYIINPIATTYIPTPHSNEYRQVKTALRAIMEKVVFNHDSIYFHCTIGTDRTGTIAYFLEGLLGVSEEDRLRDYELTYFFGLTNRTRFHDSVSWSGIKPRFYSMYRSYPTNADIYNYYTYESHVVDPNNPNDLTDDELLRRFRLELIEQ